MNISKNSILDETCLQVVNNKENSNHVHNEVIKNEINEDNQLYMKNFSKKQQLKCSTVKKNFVENKSFSIKKSVSNFNFNKNTVNSFFFKSLIRNKFKVKSTCKLNSQEEKTNPMIRSISIAFTNDNYNDLNQNLNQKNLYKSNEELVIMNQSHIKKSKFKKFSDKFKFKFKSKNGETVLEKDELELNSNSNSYSNQQSTSQLNNLNENLSKNFLKEIPELKILAQNKLKNKSTRPKSEIFSENINQDKLKVSNLRYSTYENFKISGFGKTETYQKLKQLGKGSYATVFEGYSSVINKVVALKEISLNKDEGTPFTAIREASLLKKLKHANIVILHDIIHTPESLTFVFEYVKTDLGQYMEEHQGGLNFYNVKLFLFQLFRGLEFCHEKKILHRDLKPQNLLISEKGELKIADFGLAREKSVPSKTFSDIVVTLWYRPPDVLLGSTDYSTSLDIWGVGCIFLEMVHGSVAFRGSKKSVDQLCKIFCVFGPQSEETWPGISSLPLYEPEKWMFCKKREFISLFPKLDKNSEDLALNCLSLIPDLRISAKDALKHDYFKELPYEILYLPSNLSIFSIPQIKLNDEIKK